MVHVMDEVERLSAALGRTIFVSWTGSNGIEARIMQTCPMCGIKLAMMFVAEDHQIEQRWLHRELFTFYDQHRCTLTDVMALYEAAERELVRAGERMLQLGDSDLRARAELESDRMAAFAETLRRSMG
jgi:hypothetical protein